MGGRILHSLAIACAVSQLAACGGNGLISRFTLAPSPHQRYADALRDAPLGDTAMARDWLRAGEESLLKPLTIALPIRESGYFAADQPSAVAYQFELVRGRRFAVEITFDSVERAQLFIDLFEVRDARPPERVASMTDGTTLHHDVRRDGTYLLRVQPELLRSGRYTMVQRTLASLPFPVSGLTAKAVQSEFGAERDAGRRQHEGIDIFAARHTPAVAVVSGIARPDTNTLGGNVVWLRDPLSGRSFYYAHLARAAFEGTTHVTSGEVVGYIGNTGNARTTAPHLHFGIYEGGAIDPLPFIQADQAVPPAAAGADEMLSELARVTAARSRLRAGTSQNARTLSELQRGSIVHIYGLSGTQLRVVLPDHTTGYVERSAITTATKPLREQRVQPGAVIRDEPLATAPALHVVQEPATLEVLGTFNGFELVRVASGFGWLASNP